MLGTSCVCISHIHTQYESNIFQIVFEVGKTKVCISIFFMPQRLINTGLRWIYSSVLIKSKMIGFE
jgi:hypothetical protein